MSKVRRRIATKEEKEAPHKNSIAKRMKAGKEDNSETEKIRIGGPVL